MRAEGGTAPLARFQAGVLGIDDRGLASGLKQEVAMADIYCPRCGEPWDVDSVQHAFTPEERERFWSGQGCPCCFGEEVKERPFRAEAMSVIADVLGDDIDGMAAEMEDLEYLLGPDFWA